MNPLIIKTCFLHPGLVFLVVFQMFCRKGAGGGVPEICSLDTGSTYADRNKRGKQNQTKVDNR